MKERIGFKAIANFSCKATVLILAVALCVFFTSCKKDVVENKLVEITFLSTDGYWIEDGAQVTQKKVLVPYGSALTDYKPSMPVAQYKQLAGWFEQTDSGLSDIAFRFVEPVTRPVTLYAQWKKLVEGHTVIFDGCGGKWGDLPSKIVDVDFGAAVSEPEIPVYGEREFNGWYTDTKYETMYDFSTTVEKNITLYAYWSSTSGSLTWPEFCEFIADYNGFSDEDLNVIIVDNETDSEGLDGYNVFGTDLSKYKGDSKWSKYSGGNTVYGGFKEPKLRLSLDLRGMTNVTKIKDRAFDGCLILRRVILPETAVSIGECAFDTCNGLESITVPEGVKEIKNMAFSMGVPYCSASGKKVEVELPSTLTNLHAGIFMPTNFSSGYFKITYNDTESKFWSILKKDGSGTDPAGTVYCTDGNADGAFYQWTK